MRVTFCWSVLTEAEIPEDEVLAIVMDNSGDNLAKGDALAILANKYNALPAEEGEISGVYQDWSVDANGNWIYACDKIQDEAIWEG